MKKVHFIIIGFLIILFGCSKDLNQDHSISQQTLGNKSFSSAPILEGTADWKFFKLPNTNLSILLPREATLKENGIYSSTEFNDAFFSWEFHSEKLFKNINTYLDKICPKGTISIFTKKLAEGVTIESEYRTPDGIKVMRYRPNCANMSEYLVQDRDTILILKSLGESTKKGTELFENALRSIKKDKKIIQIETLGIEFSMPLSSAMRIAPVTSSAYKEGVRVAIFSLSSEEFIEKLHTPEINDYFDFVIYEPHPASLEEVMTLLEKRCQSRKNMWEKYENTQESFTAFALDKTCYPLRTFVVLRDDKMYLIEAGQDTRNFEGVWDAIKTIHFL